MQTEQGQLLLHACAQDDKSRLERMRGKNLNSRNTRIYNVKVATLALQFAVLKWEIEQLVCERWRSADGTS